jgi:hypothetical protein
MVLITAYNNLLVGRGRDNSRGRGRYRRHSQYNQPHIDYYVRRVHFASKV